MAMQTNQPREAGAGTSSSRSAEPREKAQEIVGQAQEKAQEIVGQAQESAQIAAERVQGGLRGQLDKRSAQAADHMISQASDLRAVGSSLREQGKPGPAQAAERLAQYAERVGGYLQNKDSDALLTDAEELARRQPWVVAAGGLVLGFGASRFLKASSRKRYSVQAEGSRAATLRERPEAPVHPAVPGTPTSPPTPPATAPGPVGSTSAVPPRRGAGPPQDPPPASPGSANFGPEQ